MADISCNLPLPLLKRLEEEKLRNKYNPKSTTNIIHEALSFYFAAQDKAHYSLTYGECEQLADQQIKQDMLEVFSPGLIITEVSSQKKEPDPEIKSSFSIAPGEGVAKRLRDNGTTLLNVVKAKRAKAQGRDYDKSLEPYFHLV